MWSLDVDPEEKQLVVGGVSPQLHLYRLLGDPADTSEPGTTGRTELKEVSFSPPTFHICFCFEPEHSCTLPEL